MQRPSFSNSLAPADRIGFWQFGLVRRFDSVELHGRPRSRKCNRRAFDPPAGSTASPLRGIGIDRRRFWLHAAIWPSTPWTMAAAHFSSLLASPGTIKHPALLHFVPGSASSDHGHGVDPACAVEDPLLYRRQFGRIIAAFYGFNTLGAVAGALLGEGYLVRRFGLPGTGLIAASLSLAAAGIAWLFAGTVPVTTEAAGFQFSLGKQTPWKLLLLVWARAPSSLASRSSGSASCVCMSHPARPLFAPCLPSCWPESDSAVSLPARSERQRREKSCRLLLLAAIGTLLS